MEPLVVDSVVNEYTRFALRIPPKIFPYPIESSGAVNLASSLIDSKTLASSSGAVVERKVIFFSALHFSNAAKLSLVTFLGTVML